jgi:hypothetical protein
LSGGATPFSGITRALDGVIVSVVDLDNGRVETFSRRGAVSGERIIRGILDLLRELARELDEREGRWRVRTISSPTSILLDLRSTRLEEPTYEAYLLGRIKRLDLLESPVRTKRALRHLKQQTR